MIIKCFFWKLSVLKLESQGNNDYQTFEKNFVDILNNQAPKKSKTFRGNIKILRNAIM